MDRRLRSGESICSEMGLTLQDLAYACESGKLTAHSPQDGRNILPSNCCITEFKFNPPPVKFKVSPSYKYTTLAIRDTCFKQLRVFIDGRDIEEERACTLEEISKQHSGDPDDCLEKIRKQGKRLAVFHSKRLKKETVIYRKKKYILYLSPVFTSNKYKSIPVDDFSFQIFSNENNINFECLFFLGSQSPYCKIPWKANILFKEVQSSTEKRKYISYCSSETIEFCVNKLNRKNYGIEIDDSRYRNDLKYKRECDKILIYKDYTSLEYFHPTEKNKLTFERDFFIFNYDEYEKYMCHVTTDCSDSFYEAIAKMFFHIDAVKRLRHIDIDTEYVNSDPREYMLKLLKNAIDMVSYDKDTQRKIKAYELKIRGFKNEEVYRMVNNIEEKDIHLWRGEKSPVSVYLNEVKPILAKFGIPFIGWRDLIKLANERNIEERDRQKHEIASEMIRQLECFNFEKD